MLPAPELNATLKSISLSITSIRRRLAETDETEGHRPALQEQLDTLISARDILEGGT